MDSRLSIRRDAGGFTIVELLVAVAIVAMLAAIAYVYLQGTRTKRLVYEAVNTLPALKSWEDRQWERAGAFVFSASDTDIIGFASVGWEKCESRLSGEALQDATYDEVTPEGCQWDYFVINDRCADGCPDGGAGDSCELDGKCYCIIAQKAQAANKVVDALIGGERFCIDDAGNQFTTMSTHKPPSWR